MKENVVSEEWSELIRKFNNLYSMHYHLSSMGDGYIVKNLHNEINKILRYGDNEDKKLILEMIYEECLPMSPFEKVISDNNHFEDIYEMKSTDEKNVSYETDYSDNLNEMLELKREINKCIDKYITMDKEIIRKDFYIEFNSGKDFRDLLSILALLCNSKFETIYENIADILIKEAVIGHEWTAGRSSSLFYRYDKEFLEKNREKFTKIVFNETEDHKDDFAVFFQGYKALIRLGYEKAAVKYVKKYYHELKDDIDEEEMEEILKDLEV